MTVPGDGSSSTLTSGRLLARNVMLNAAGGLVPAVAMLVAIPTLIRAMGDARFGIVALAWTAVGYFSLFDLGIGRALTHAAASRLGEGRPDEIPEVTWTALALLTPIAVGGGVLLYLAAPWLTVAALDVPPELQGEAQTAFRVLAVAIPLTALAALLRGVLEALQRFGLVNALRVPYGVITFLGPIAVLPFSRSAVPAIAMLAAGRLLLVVAYFLACRAAIPGFSRGRVNRALVRTLLTFGGWMTVSNVVSPIMNTVDRFVVGAVMTVSAVTYYATPHELVTRMWLYTAALLPVFFPAFATSAVTDRARTARLYDRCMRALFAGLWLPTFLLVLLAGPILRLWVGEEIATQSASVLQVLAVAVFVNALGQGALTLVHSLGRPDLSGKFHLAELPLYALLLWLLLPRYGIVGVAIAWAIRAVVDAGLLMAASRALLPEARGGVARIGWWLVLGAPAFVAAPFLGAGSARYVVATLATFAWCAIVWWGILTPDERSAPLRVLRPARAGE